MNQLERLFRRARSHPIVTFTTGSLVSAALSLVLQAIVVNDGIWSATLAAFAILTAAVALTLYLRTLAASWRPNRDRRGPPPPARRGLIFVFSKAETFDAAFDYHSNVLEYVWLILTPESKAIATNHITRYQNKQVLFLFQDIKSAWAAHQTAGAVERALHQAQHDFDLSVDDLVCDVTGGTKAMTAGAAAACTRLSILLQIVPGEYNSLLNVQRPIFPMKLVVDPEAAREAKENHVISS